MSEIHEILKTFYLFRTQARRKKQCIKEKIIWDIIIY